MKKKLKINAATCDVRKVREETLAAYDEIQINAASILTNPEARALLTRYAVKINCANALDLEKNVRIMTVNGSMEISSTDPILPGPCFLMVSGTLSIGPGTQSVLAQYVGIMVDGSVLYPKSMGGALSMLTVNGSTVCYPDGAVVLKANTAIDRNFVLRAKNSLYWAARRLIMVDPELDPGALAAKGARFSAGEAIIARSKVEGMAALLDEKTDIIVVPDGTAVVRDDLTLSPPAIRRYGRKLYVIGDVTVEKDGADALAQLEYLHIRGNVAVPLALRDRLLECAEAISGDVNILRGGRTLRDKNDVRISAWILKRELEGITVTDCAAVRLDADIDKGLILDRLTVKDCDVVYCTLEQEDAVMAVCQDVSMVNTGENNAEDNREPEEDAEVSTINAASYIL